MGENPLDIIIRVSEVVEYVEASHNAFNHREYKEALEFLERAWWAYQALRTDDDD